MRATPTPCPYSSARLWEMYWREVWTLAEIAQHASGVLGFSRPLGHNVAKRWLLDARISIRTAGESLSLRAIRNTPGVELPPKLKPGKRCRGFNRPPPRPPALRILARCQPEGRTLRALQNLPERAEQHLFPNTILPDSEAAAESEGERTEQAHSR